MWVIIVVENRNPRWRITTRGRCWNRHKGTRQQSTGPNWADSRRHVDQCQLLFFGVPLEYVARHHQLGWILPGGESGPALGYNKLSFNVPILKGVRHDPQVHPIDL